MGESKPGMSTCKKICIGCTVGAVVFAAVMIPVGLLVIAPKMAQAAIDQSVFHIANGTVFNVPANFNESGLGFNPYNGWASQNLTVESPFFLGGRLHEANVSMIINMPAADGAYGLDGFSAGEIAWFTMPETTVAKGVNVINFTVPMHFNSTADAGFRFASWGYWVMGLFPPSTGVVYIDIIAKPKLTALGFITVETTLKKTLACNCIKGTEHCNEFPKQNRSAAWAAHPAVRPFTYWPEDESFTQPHHDNKTQDPPSQFFPNGNLSWMPKISLFCEPIGTEVWNGSAIMPIVTTTTTTAGQAFSV